MDDDIHFDSWFYNLEDMVDFQGISDEIWENNVNIEEIKEGIGYDVEHILIDSFPLITF